MGLGTLALRGGMPSAQRLAVIERASALFRELGDTELHLGGSQPLSRVGCQRGDYGRAQACLAEARALIGPRHAVGFHADLAIWHAMACALGGQHAAAEAIYLQALSHCHVQGDAEFFFLVMTDLAELEWVLGHAEVALPRLRPMVATAQARRLHRL